MRRQGIHKKEVIEQLRKLTPRIIPSIVKAPDGYGPIFFRKIDIKDGFWIIIFQAGAEWNFAYVLPGEAKEEKILVTTSSPQMVWTITTKYFCIAT